MIHATLLFFLVGWYYRRTHEVKDGKATIKPGHMTGETIAVLTMGWTLPRVAIIEFFRGDTDRGMWFGGYVSTGQITGGIVFLVALAVFIYLRKRARRAAAA